MSCAPSTSCGMPDHPDSPVGDRFRPCTSRARTRCRAHAVLSSVPLTHARLLPILSRCHTAGAGDSCSCHCSCNFDRDNETGEIFTLEIAPVAHQAQCAWEAHAEREVRPGQASVGLCVELAFGLLVKQHPAALAATEDFSGFFLFGRDVRERLALVLSGKLCLR